MNNKSCCAGCECSGDHGHFGRERVATCRRGGESRKTRTGSAHKAIGFGFLTLPFDNPPGHPPTHLYMRATEQRPEVAALADAERSSPGEVASHRPSEAMPARLSGRR